MVAVITFVVVALLLTLCVLVLADSFLRARHQIANLKRAQAVHTVMFGTPSPRRSRIRSSAPRLRGYSDSPVAPRSCSKKALAA